MVLEAGTWELDNGALLEVGSVNTSLVTTEGWENIGFNADFADAPVVLSQVQTNAESDFVRTRQKPSTIDGFSLAMDLKASGHANETVGWLAIDAGKVLGETWNIKQDILAEKLLIVSIISISVKTLLVSHTYLPL